MSYISDFEKELPGLQPLWNAWYVDERIGDGSYSTVYRIKRTEMDGQEYYAALKVVCLPGSESERNHIVSMTNNEEEARRFVAEMAGSITQEISIMYELKGRSNIVSYEDHQVIERKDDIGYYVLIRMELLTNFVTILREREQYPMTGEDVIRLGIDICSALETCEKHHIIHRDIKPDNLFVSGDGNYKLGDFGISRKMDRTMLASSKGTVAYMAPEVYKSTTYNRKADIYSLGVVMYQLLNDNRLPLLPDNFKYADIESAIEKRLTGTSLPLPKNAQNELGHLTLKACAYHPDARFESPAAMRKALEALLNSGEIPVQPSGEIADGRPTDTTEEGQMVILPGVTPLPGVRKSRKGLAALIAVLSLITVFLIGAGALVLSGNLTLPAFLSFQGSSQAMEYGTSQGNLDCGGFAVQLDGYLYKSDDKGGHKVNLETGEKTYFNEIIMNNLNVYDGWIYYTDRLPRFDEIERDGGSISYTLRDGYIYRMRPGQAESPQLIDNEGCYRMLVTEKGIVFIRVVELETKPLDSGDGGDKNAEETETEYRYDLYTMNHNGSNLVCLAKDIGSYSDLWADDQWVYYEEKDSNGHLNRVDYRGKVTEVVIEETYSAFLLSGDSVYYIAYRLEEGNTSLYRKDLEKPDSAAEQIWKLPGSSMSLNACIVEEGGDIFISMMEDNIYVMREGSDVCEPLLEEKFERVITKAIVGEWIYFGASLVDEEDAPPEWRVRTDGTGLESYEYQEFSYLAGMYWFFGG